MVSINRIVSKVVSTVSGPLHTWGRKIESAPAPVVHARAPAQKAIRAKAKAVMKAQKAKKAKASKCRKSGRCRTCRCS